MSSLNFSSTEITDLVLDEVRQLRAQYSTTSPFPVGVGGTPKTTATGIGASGSSSGSSVLLPAKPRILRQYSTRPANASSSVDASASTTTTYSNSDVAGIMFLDTSMTSTSTSSSKSTSRSPGVASSTSDRRSASRKRAFEDEVGSGSGTGTGSGVHRGSGDAGSSVVSTSSTAFTPVLHYSLSNVTYRVNLEALSRVFSQYGRLIKLTRFPATGVISGYVQFETVAAAQISITKLQGRNIYHGCCRLHLSATDIPDLRGRPDLDDGKHAQRYLSQQHQQQQLQQQQQQQQLDPRGRRNSGVGFGGGDGRAMGSGDFGPPNDRYNINKDNTNNNNNYNNNNNGGRRYLDEPDFRSSNKRPSYPDDVCGGVYNNANNGGGFGCSGGACGPNLGGNNNNNNNNGFRGDFPGFSGDYSRPVAEPMWPVEDVAPRRGGGGGGARGGEFGISFDDPLRALEASCQKSVLFVTNLNESKVTVDRLFMIFGVYCDVLKVKIFYREKSKAVIQAVDGFQADSARRYLDKVLLWGRTLSVTFASAKYREINIHPGSDETWAKDFSFSFASHRFRGSFGNKHLQNSTWPIPTLYVSHVPKGASEEDLKRFFEDCIGKADEMEKPHQEKEVKVKDKDDEDDKDVKSEDGVELPSSTSSSSSSAKVLKVQFFPNSDRMAFVEMADVDAAFDAIIHVHDRRLETASGDHFKGRPLFVNFSKVHLADFNRTGWGTLFRG